MYCKSHPIKQKRRNWNISEAEQGQVEICTFMEHFRSICLTIRPMCSDSLLGLICQWPSFSSRIVKNFFFSNQALLNIPHSWDGKVLPVDNFG